MKKEEVVARVLEMRRRLRGMAVRSRCNKADAGARWLGFWWLLGL